MSTRKQVPCPIASRSSGRGVQVVLERWKKKKSWVSTDDMSRRKMYQALFSPLFWFLIHFFIQVTVCASFLFTTRGFPHPTSSILYPWSHEMWDRKRKWEEWLVYCNWWSQNSNLDCKWRVKEKIRKKNYPSEVSSEPKEQITDPETTDPPVHTNALAFAITITSVLVY